MLNEACKILLAASIGYLLGFITVFITVINSKWFYRNNIQISSFFLRNNIHTPNVMGAVSDPTRTMHKSHFCTYYKAIMPCGKNYYVKRFNWENQTFQLKGFSKFCREIKALGSLQNNPSLLAPLGYVLTSPYPLIVYEYPQKGTLFELLHGGNNGGGVLSWECRCVIAVGIARGLAFLHGKNKPIVLLHFSTKSIFMQSLWEPRIADIELTRVITISKAIATRSVLGHSFGYNPPEYACTMRVTSSGNIYSFGMILLELLTGKANSGREVELVKLVQRELAMNDYKNSMEKLLDSRIFTASSETHRQISSMLKIALRCVSFYPKDRPNASDVLRMLELDM